MPACHGVRQLRGRSSPRLTPPLMSCQNHTACPTLNVWGDLPCRLSSTARARRVRSPSAAACSRMAAAPSLNTRGASVPGASGCRSSAAAMLAAVLGSPPKKSANGEGRPLRLNALYWYTAWRNSARHAPKSTIRRRHARIITHTRSVAPAALG